MKFICQYISDTLSTEPKCVLRDDHGGSCVERTFLILNIYALLIVVYKEMYSTVVNRNNDYFNGVPMFYMFCPVQRAILHPVIHLSCFILAAECDQCFLWTPAIS